jgi:hypothetical protein
MKTIFYSFVLLISSYISCFAESNKKDEFTAVGIGVTYCYEFLHPGDQSYTNREASYMGWAQGFMSAKNVYTKNNIDLLFIDPKEQMIILKIFCEENKRKLFGNAVEHLYSELYQKSQQEK